MSDRTKTLRGIWIILAVLALVLASCASGETSSSVAASSDAATTPDEVEASPEPTPTSIIEQADEEAAEPVLDNSGSESDNENGPAEETGPAEAEPTAKAAPEDTTTETNEDDKPNEVEQPLSVGSAILEATDGSPEISTIEAEGGQIPPGSYALNVLGDELTLTLDTELLLFESNPGFFTYSTADLLGQGVFLGLMKTVGIVPPRDVGSHLPHDPAIPDVTIDIPADLTTWLDAVPQVILVDSGTAEVLGEPAVWYRLSVDPEQGPTFSCPLDPSCVGFAVMHDGVTVLGPSIDVTIWQLEAAPNIMPWVQVTDVAVADAATEAMNAVLAGLGRS